MKTKETQLSLRYSVEGWVPSSYIRMLELQPHFKTSYTLFCRCDKTRPRQLIEGRVYLGLWFQRDKSPSPKWQGGIAAGRHGGWKSKLGAHVFNHKQKAEGINKKKEEAPALRAHLIRFIQHNHILSVPKEHHYGDSLTRMTTEPQGGTEGRGDSETSHRVAGLKRGFQYKPQFNGSGIIH